VNTTKIRERAHAAALGDGPLAMFDDGLLLQFLHGPQQFLHGPQQVGRPETIGANTVEFSSKREDEWQQRATEAAIGSARKIAASRAQVHVGRLSDHEWSMIVTGAIFDWIEVRVQQAIAEGLDQEQAVRLTGLSPNPCDIAVVMSILPTLADTGGIDWSLPLSVWSKDTMTNFLMLAWQLLRDAEHARDHGPGRIIKKASFDVQSGDPIPFVP
jgi:hypothetical protein